MPFNSNQTNYNDWHGIVIWNGHKTEYTPKTKTKQHSRIHFLCLSLWRSEIRSIVNKNSCCFTFCTNQILIAHWNRYYVFSNYFAICVCGWIWLFFPSSLPFVFVFLSCCNCFFFPVSKEKTHFLCFIGSRVFIVIIWLGHSNGPAYQSIYYCEFRWRKDLIKYSIAYFC